MIISRILIKITFLIALLSFTSCAGQKESKRIKKGSQVIRDSEILLGADFQGPASSYSFHLRKNNFFDYTASAMLGWDYYAGTWKIQKDTIILDFIDGHKMSDLTGKAYIDTDKNRLHLQKIDGRTTFLEIFINKLK